MKLFTKHKNWIVWIDLCVIVLLAVYVIGFTASLRSSSRQTEIQRIKESMDSMEQKTTLYLEDSCAVVRDWAHLVALRSCDREEILQNLSDLNANPQITIEVIDPETMTGLAIQENGQLCEVDYSKYYYLGLEAESFFENPPETGSYVTSTFNNPANSVQSIAFVAAVPVKTREGTKSCLLMRVEPISVVAEHWETSDVYSGAQVSLVNTDGAYMMRAPMLKNNNFFEFLRSYNDLTYGEIEELQNEIAQADQAGALIYKNAQGRDTLFVYSSKIDGKWFFVGAIEVADLPKSGVQWSLLGVLTAGFLLLIVVNCAYYIAINRQLREGLAQADQANIAKTRFLSSMSHDIRTPMNAIIGMTTVATYNLDDTEMVKECLHKISMAGNLLLTLINDILDMSKIESGKFTLSLRPISLEEEFSNLINIVYPQTREKNIQLDVQLANITQEAILADKLRLSQIWINILSNAIKYTPENGKIHVTMREELLHDNKVRLIYQVADTGIGMSEEYLKRIFEPFTREQDNRVDKIQGSGLGMAITKQMVDLMGGTIQVQSKQGCGSTFTVSLDFECAPGTTQRLKIAPMRVLVLAGPAARPELGRILGELGVQADFAASIQAAAACLKREPYDLLLLDHCPPEMDGVAAAAALQRAAGPLPKAMLCTYDWAEVESAAAAAGIRTAIQRPVFGSTMAKALAALNHTDATADNGAPKNAMADMQGVHLLVAEDNDLNWEVLQELLSIIGVTADRAANGCECVDMLKKAAPGQYAMIFMDVQMPELNGYEATKLIRTMKDTEKASIPIVAMTADAFAEDVAACLKAGMNAHIAKPVAINNIVEEIRKFAIDKRN